MLALDHWHIEPSSICALKCPRCPRAEVPQSLLNRQLTLQFFQDQIGAAVVANMRKITFCGNDGDPIYCRDLIDICAWIKQVNPTVSMTLITNGSYRDDDWWRRLAQVLGSNDEINWSIDGWDQDSNQQYRVASDWTSIMAGIKAFTAINQHSYRVWATIAFRFNQDHLDRISQLAAAAGMDLWQLTRSTKFGSHYPDTYGSDDALCPDRPDLVSSSQRFERSSQRLTARDRPGTELAELFWQRANTLAQKQQYSALCLVGTKGVFVNSRGEFYPCCWTANRYEHNRHWHDLGQHRFNLHQRSFQDIMADQFWQQEFLEFSSQECRTKCTPQRLKDRDHAAEW